MNRRLVCLVSLCVTASAHAQPSSRASLRERIDSIAAAPVKSGTVAGMAVAVIKGRDTLLFKGYGLADVENQVPATPQTVFRIGSITKQFTSSAVMQLVEQGKIGRDDEITKYIPSFPTHGKRILVRHLLNHTSGIPSYTDIGPRFGAVMRLDLARDSLIGMVAPLSLMFDPGTHFYYNNTGYYMLGMVIERVTGKKYGDYLAEQLFTPLGLSSTVYCDTRRIIPHRAQGYERVASGLQNADFLSMDLPFAAGSLCSTIGDLVSWTWQLASGRVVSAASYREMTTPVTLSSGRPMSYGYGLGSDTLSGHRVIQHGGGINGFISQLMFLPGDSLVIAVLANTAPAPSDVVASAIARAVLGLPAAAPPSNADVALPAAERARYVGNYTLTRSDGTKRELRILEKDGQLMAQFEGLPAAVPMSYRGSNTFLARGIGQMKFDVAGGRVTGFVLGGGGRPLEGERRP